MSPEAYLGAAMLLGGLARQAHQRGAGRVLIVDSLRMPPDVLGNVLSRINARDGWSATFHNGFIFAVRDRANRKPFF